MAFGTVRSVEAATFILQTRTVMHLANVFGLAKRMGRTAMRLNGHCLIDGYGSDLT
mgnify:CR=1 FL=1